jgi:hypothetical protein
MPRRASIERVLEARAAIAAELEFGTVGDERAALEAAVAALDRAYQRLCDAWPAAEAHRRNGGPRRQAS